MHDPERNKTGGWKTAAMFRRYAIESSADQRTVVEMLERARAENGHDFGHDSTVSGDNSGASETVKVN
jgi:hypothetical protein